MYPRTNPSLTEGYKCYCGRAPGRHQQTAAPLAREECLADLRHILARYDLKLRPKVLEAQERPFTVSRLDRRGDFAAKRSLSFRRREGRVCNCNGVCRSLVGDERLRFFCHTGRTTRVFALRADAATPTQTVASRGVAVRSLLSSPILTSAIHASRDDKGKLEQRKQ